MKKFIVFLLCGILMFSVVGCKNNPTSESEKPGNDDPMQFQEEEMEKNYVYMWHRDGLIGDQNRMFFQSEEYKLSVDSKTAKIIGIANSDDEFYEMNDEDLKAVETTFDLKIGDTYYPSVNSGTQGRIIDSGRYVNRFDNTTVRFKNQGLNKFGRVEYIATKNFIALNYEILSSESGDFGLRMTFDLTGNTATQILEGRGYKSLDSDGNGFAFIKQFNSTATLAVEDSKIICEQSNIL